MRFFKMYSNFLTIFVLIFAQALCMPTSDQNSLVISSTEATSSSSTSSKDVAGSNVDNQDDRIDIYEMDIKSNVSNRFATTLVTSKVKNLGKSSKEATFTIVLPEQAFISGFIMEIDGKEYKAYVKKKEDAKQIYDEAVSSGIGAGLVSASARDSNKFTVSVNVEPTSKATFYLTYEELLERQDGQYELILNIHPGQIVKNLNAEVHINESLPLKFVQTPALRSGNEISTKENEDLKPTTDIEIINQTSAVVKFHPSIEEQKNFGKNMGDKKESDGLAGQFIVQYEVERDPEGGKILLQDGYFVHFFAPSDLKPLKKEVLFVLDTSGSMSGRKIEQLKEAMKEILPELVGDNLFNIIDFSTEVSVFDSASNNKTEVIGVGGEPFDYNNPFPHLREKNIPKSVPATAENVEKAKTFVDSLQDTSATNIIGGLEVALHIAANRKMQNKTDDYQPIIIFLTDGYPNVGPSQPDEINDIVTKLNKDHKIPIFSLAFGEGTDRSFLRKLSLNNQGFARRIYEAADASIQLRKFFRYVTSPLLSNVEFKYNDPVSANTKTNFPIYFSGSELVVSGRYTKELPIICTIDGDGFASTINLHPKVQEVVTPLERLWAYLTIKDLLKKKEVVKNQENVTKEALDLALKYSFVTELTSLVVVKPNETSKAVDTEDALNANDNRGFSSGFAGSSGPMYFRTGGYSGRQGGLTTFGKSNVQYHSIPLAISTKNSISPVSQVAPLGLPGLPAQLEPVFDFDSVPDSMDISTIVPKPLTIESPQDMWTTLISDANSTITLSSSATYKLDWVTTTPPTKFDSCKSLNGTVDGECVLLKNCKSLFPQLVNFDDFEKNYFCPLDENRVAGICCPKANQEITTS